MALLTYLSLLPKDITLSGILGSQLSKYFIDILQVFKFENQWSMKKKLSKSHFAYLQITS